MDRTKKQVFQSRIDASRRLPRNLVFFRDQVNQRRLRKGHLDGLDPGRSRLRSLLDRSLPSNFRHQPFLSSNEPPIQRATFARICHALAIRNDLLTFSTAESRDFRGATVAFVVSSQRFNQQPVSKGTATRFLLPHITHTHQRRSAAGRNRLCNLKPHLIRRIRRDLGKRVHRERIMGNRRRRRRFCCALCVGEIVGVAGYQRSDSGTPA